MRSVIAAAVLVTSFVVPASPADADVSPPPKPGPIAFDGEGANSREIFTSNIDGSARTQLTDNTVTDMQPSWSPGATRIAFSRKVPHWGYEIFVMNADGTGQTRVTYRKGNDVEPAWSLFTNTIAFASSQGGDFEIYTVRPNGRHLRQLTNNTAGDTNPAWNSSCSPPYCVPGGLLFQTDRAGNSDIYEVRDQVGAQDGATPASGPGDQSDPVGGWDGGFYFADVGVGGSRLGYVYNWNPPTFMATDGATHAAPAVAIGENVMAEVRTGLGAEDGIYVGEDWTAWAGVPSWPGLVKVGDATDRDPALPLEDSGTIAKVNLLHALAVADQVKTNTGSYGGSPPGLPASMAALYSAFAYSWGASDSWGPMWLGTASAGASNETVGLSAFANRADPPACYYISETSGVVTYGGYVGADASTTCSGNDALAGATNPSW